MSEIEGLSVRAHARIRARVTVGTYERYARLNPVVCSTVSTSQTLVRLT